MRRGEEVAFGAENLKKLTRRWATKPQGSYNSPPLAEFFFLFILQIL
jgi:hypothetical protein